MLLKDSHGERFPNMHAKISVTDDGRLSATEEKAGHIHTLLPNVTVRVCEKCNNEWMSGLEDSVKESLGEYIFGSAEWLKLDCEDVRKIALWSIKSFMAYYLTRSPIENPFTITDYRLMANDRVPPNRCQVWMFNSHHHRAQVGLGVYSTYFSRGATVNEMANEINNFCICYLAASCVVFVLVRTPPELPSPVLDTLIPRQLKSRGVRRIWPTPRSQYFPLEPMSDRDFEQLLLFPELLAAHGLPTIGLNAAELAQVREDFLQG